MLTDSSDHQQTFSSGQKSKVEDFRPCSTDQEIVRIYTQLVSSKNANSVSYVTFKLDSKTTCRQVKEWALKKLQPNRKWSATAPGDRSASLSSDDVRFYDIVMVVESASNNNEIFKSIPLWSDDRPLLRLRQYPRHLFAVNFYLTSTENVKVKIFTGDIFLGQTYKTIVITRETTCQEAHNMILNGKQSSLNQNLVIVQVDNYEQNEKMIPENDTLIEYLTNYSTLHLKYWNENLVTNVAKIQTFRTNSNVCSSTTESSSANSEYSY